MHTEQNFEEKDLVARYINDLEGYRNVLYCYKVNGKYVSVLKKMEHEEYLATIKEMDCSSTKKLFDESYLFPWIREGSMSVRLYMAMGIRPSSNSDAWCRYDICLDCYKNKARFSQDTKPTPEHGFYRWSEPAIDIQNTNFKDPFRPFNQLNTKANMVAEYLSVGETKFVLHCYLYENKYYSVIRSTMGQRIATVSGMDCSPGQEFIQMFYIYTPIIESKKDGKKDKKETLKWHIFKLGDKITNTDLAWYNGQGEQNLNKRSMYYFTADSKSKNCYWKQIQTGETNTCPSLPHGNIQEYDDSPHYFRKTHKDISAVAQYTNGAKRNKFNLKCFRTVENRNVYYSVVTDLNDRHVITVKGIDCTSKDILEQRFYVNTVYEDLKALVVGSRSSQKDEWCFYYFYKDFDSSVRGYTYRKWIYYDYQRDNAATSWSKVNVDRCPRLKKEDITVGGEDPKRGNVIARYLWYNQSPNKSLLLYCYEIKAGKEYISVIKTPKEKVVASIKGIDCSSKSALKEKTYMFFKENLHNKYLSIGTRVSSIYDWCRYDFCVDCEKNEVKLNLDNRPYEDFIEWSEAAIEWKGSTSYSLFSEKKEFSKQYMSKGASKFVVSCIKKANSKYEGVFRTTSGEFIATFPIDFDCSTNYFEFYFFFHTKWADGRLKLYDIYHCQRESGCDVNPENGDKESWLYYFIEVKQRMDISNFRVLTESSSNSCPAIRDEDIVMRKLNGESVLTKYLNGENPAFLLSCVKGESGVESSYNLHVTYNDQHLLTVKNYDCRSKDKIAQKISIAPMSLDGDIKYVAVGSRLSTTDEWCWYTVQLTSEKVQNVWLHYGYKLDDMAFQWYLEDSASCGQVKKEKIIVKQKTSNDDETEDNTSTLIPSYIGIIDKAYTKLFCLEKVHEGKKYYTTVVKSEDGDQTTPQVTINDLDCTSKDSLKNIYMSYTKRNDKKYMVLGTKEPESNGWCRYDICLNCETQDIRVNIDDQPKKEVLKWSEPSIKIESNPSFKEKYIPKDDTGNALTVENFVEEYFTSSLYVHFRVQCYQTDTNANKKYTSVIRSDRGLHLGTFHGDNCLDKNNLFEMAYIHITEGTKTIISRDLTFGMDPVHNEWFCWYYSCNKQESSKETNIFYFFHAFKEKSKEVDWQKEEKDSYNSCRDLKKEDILLKDTNNVEERGTLIAKYVRRGDPRYQLLCYQEVENEQFKYTFVVKDSDGQHIATIDGYDCTPRFGEPTKRIYFHPDNRESDEGKDFIIVGTVFCVYSICKNCETSNIEVYHRFTPGSGYYWKEVPLDACPSYKRENIILMENEIELDKGEEISRYINNIDNVIGKETFLLHCYRMVNSDNIKEYVSVVRNLQGSYLASFKNLDCSSMESFSKNSYISFVKSRKKELLLLGTRLAQGGDVGPWCQYDICLHCETINVNPVQIAPAFFFMWSEAGIQTNKCPSPIEGAIPKDSKGNTLLGKNIVAEYVDSKSLAFVLDCYEVEEEKPEETKTHYLSLRASQGLNVATTPITDCLLLENIYKNFYMYIKKTDNQVQLHKLGQPTTEWCWNTGSEIALNDVWVYFFRTKEGYSREPRWGKTFGDEHNNCPGLKRGDITSEDEGTKHVNKEETTKYWSGGNPQFKLTCYKVPGEQVYYFATIQNKENIHVVSIKNFDCSSTESINRKLYVHTLYGNEDIDFMVIGSRLDFILDWCTYSFYKQWETENIWVYHGYKPQASVTKWFKDDTENCPAVKRENIFTNENEMTFDNKIVYSMYVMEVWKELNFVKEAFLIICYSEEVDSKTVYYLVIRTKTGRHVATIKDFDCSSQMSPFLHEKTYMFMVSDHEDYKYLAFGSRSSSTEKWCQYDIRIEGEKKEVRINIDVRGSVELRFQWSEPGKKIDNSPSLKRQEPTYDRGAPIQSKDFDIAYVNYYNPYLVLNCYLDTFTDKTQVTTQTYHSVIRSNMGRHITTISGETCAVQNGLFKVGYVLVKKEDGTANLSELDTRKPPPRGEESCWFYGCHTCPIHETRLFIFKRVPHVWREVKRKNDECPKSLEKSQATSEQRHLESAGTLIAEYKNTEGYLLECYLEESRRMQYGIIKTSEGKLVTTLENFSCSSIEELQNKFDVFVPTKFDNEDEVDLLVIRIGSNPTSSLYCSYVICMDCEKEKIFDYYSVSNNFRSDWTRIPPENCHTLSKEKVHTNEGEIDLRGYDIVATYLNIHSQVEDFFILICYRKVERLYKKYVTQLKTLNGAHIVSFEGPDCSSIGSFNGEIEIYNERVEEKHYLILNAWTTSRRIFRYSCGYEICINCETKNIQVRIKSNGHLELFKWSQAGIKVSDPAEKSCNSKEIKDVNLVSTLANTDFPEFSIDCFKVVDTKTKNHKHCSIIMTGDAQLGTIADAVCILDRLSIKDFYFYTLYTNGDFSLLKLGDKDKKEGDVKRVTKESWFYYVPHPKAQSYDWKLVSNPKISLMNSMDSPITECLPQQKTPQDLGFTSKPEGEKNTKKKRRSSLFGGDNK